MGQALGAIPEKMAETQKVNMMAQRELMMATQVAKLRDDFSWLCMLHGTIGTGLLGGFAATKNPRLLVPFVPISFSLAYTYDVAYGTKFDRIRHNAEIILETEREKFAVPAGNRLITPEEYTLRIIRGKA